MIHLPKSYPAPACLAIEKNKASGDYKCGEVLERLRDDFKNKCYICEFKGPTSIHVEHFVPHRGDHDLKFDWDNLFWACAHCNNIKLARREYDDILNCTNAADAVDRKIRYQIRPLPKELAQITALDDSATVSNSVKLLVEVYNGTTPLKRIESINLRDALLKEIRAFQDLLFDYEDEEIGSPEGEYFRRKIIKELREGSSFTAFKRWMIRDSAWFRAQFADYV